MTSDYEKKATFAGALIARVHPGGAYRMASSVYAVAIIVMLLLAFLVPGQALAWMLIPVLIAGLGRGGLNYIPWNTYSLGRRPPAARSARTDDDLSAPSKTAQHEASTTARG